MSTSHSSEEEKQQHKDPQERSLGMHLPPDASSGDSTHSLSPRAEKASMEWGK